MKIAMPLIFAYLADVATIIVAKAVVGRLGYRELAAVGVSVDVSFQFAIVLMGFFSVVGVLAASAIGAGRRSEALPALFQGMLLAAFCGVGLTVLVFNLGPVLRLAGQDPAVVALAEPFYKNYAFAMLPTVWFSVIRSFVAALMRTGAVLAVTVVTVAFNAAMMQGLVHGALGLPALGMAGAGLSWTASAWFRCLALAAFAWWLIRRERLHVPGTPWFAGATDLMPLIRLGLPVAGIVALESGLFAAVSLLSGTLGAVALAAYQMMMGWIAIPFVISLGLAEAAMVRVSYWAGAREGAAARQAGNLAMAIGVAVPLALVAIPLAAPSLVSRMFLDPGDRGYAEIAALVANLLLIAALFQVFDGLQAIASHALRGLRDATMPLVIAGVGYWAIGLGSAWLLAFRLGAGVYGLWWGLAFGLIFTGSVLAWRFERLARSIARGR